MAGESISSLAAVSTRSRPRTAAEFVAGALRRAIVNGALEGGTRLALADVAAEFQVSTTPVREALRQLSFEGLVHLDAYRGGTVDVVSYEDAAEIVRIRQVLEPILISEAVARMDEEVLQAAEKVLQSMSVEGDWDSWVHTNRVFHNLLYSPSSSRRLIGVIKSLQNPTLMFVSRALGRDPKLRRRADSEHHQLLEAMRARDVDRAIELTLAHLEIPLTDSTG